MLESLPAGGGEGRGAKRSCQGAAWVLVSRLVLRPALACAAAAAVAVGCGSPHGTDRKGEAHIDLLARLHDAQTAPRRDGQSFLLEEVTIHGERKRAVIVPQPSRITWATRLPDHAVLTGAVGIAPEGPERRDTGLRIGISNGRSYIGLYGQKGGEPGWRPIRVDLSDYSGWKWSVFYRPSRTTWNLVFSVDGTGGGAAWAELVVRGGR